MKVSISLQVFDVVISLLKTLLKKSSQTYLTFIEIKSIGMYTKILCHNIGNNT